ncbi:MAG: hypothetical protein ACI9FJ_000232 [Alteromonadaceae bacterium]|jgi:hypothetical protein
MALEFELKLIMPSESFTIFCRGSLESTRYLIKHQHPHIAAALTGVLAQDPLPIGNENCDDVYQQSFYVDITPSHVNTIVEVLLMIIENQEDTHSAGYVVLAKSLFKNWIKLAQALA